MAVFYRSEDTIPTLPIVVKGKYNKLFSYVLIGGSSYKPANFDKFEVSKKDDFYREFNYEREYPNINFQQDLSKITTTFSFSRPIDLLNNNLYEKNKYDIYIGSRSDLSIKKYAQFIRKLLNYHNVSPPYIFVGFSEGGWDSLAFAKYYPNLVEKIFFIDSFAGKAFEKYEIMRGNKKWFIETTKGVFPPLPSKIDLNNREDLEKVDEYNFNVKTYTFFRNREALLKINKSIPLIFYWAENHWETVDGKINLLGKPKSMILFKKKYCKSLKNEYRLNVTECRFFDAPHQIERVLPVTLANFIKKASLNLNVSIK